MSGKENKLIKLVIPRSIPSNNELLRMHWSEQRRLTKMWAKEVMVAKCEQLKKVPENLPQLKAVILVSYRPRFIKDDDNLHGGCKPILDALKQNGLIYDDSRKFCDLAVSQILAEDNFRTEILIIPLASPEEPRRKQSRRGSRS